MPTSWASRVPTLPTARLHSRASHARRRVRTVAAPLRACARAAMTASGKTARARPTAVRAVASVVHRYRQERIEGSARAYCSRASPTSINRAAIDAWPAVPLERMEAAVSVQAVCPACARERSGLARATCAVRPAPTNGAGHSRHPPVHERPPRASRSPSWRVACASSVQRRFYAKHRRRAERRDRFEAPSSRGDDCVVRQSWSRLRDGSGRAPLNCLQPTGCFEERRCFPSPRVTGGHVRIQLRYQ